MAESDKVVPMVPDGGNANSPSVKPTKRSAPWGSFVFRLSNYTQEDMDNITGSRGSHIYRLGFQEEDTDDSGQPTTPHLQGFGQWCVNKKKKKRPVPVFEKLLGHKRTHFEVMKGSVMDNVKYCTSEFYEGRRKRKKGGFVYTRNCPRPLVKMTYEHLNEDQQKIVDRYKGFEDPLFGREIHWYWEPKGEWGKTKTQKYMMDNMNATMVGGTKHDMFYALSELLLSTGEVPPIVIINLVKDTDMKYVSYAGMESIKDGCFFNKKFKSGMCRFNSPHLLVFANEPPDLSRFTRGTTKHRCVVYPLTDEAREDWSID